MSFLLEAIRRNIGRMFYTLLLAIILLYMYSVITIAFFKNQYGLAGQFDCNDLISCFKLQIDYGLVNPPEWIGNGYINPFYGRPVDTTTYGYVVGMLGGTVFNFTYIILINLVLQAIISGLIIDTFGEMRAESEAIEDDIRERCFMCSIDRSLPFPLPPSAVPEMCSSRPTSPSSSTSSRSTTCGSTCGSPSTWSPRTPSPTPAQSSTSTRTSSTRM
jgi:hypothetical protein